MKRWDLYTIKHAVSIFLDREKEEDTDWVNEVVVNITTNQIITWNVDGVTEPTNSELESAYNTAKLNYYKELQIKKLSSQFEEFSVSGGTGCTTTVLDDNSDPIVVDCRRGKEHNDVQSYKSAHDLMIEDSMTSIEFVDYNNVRHTVTASELETIYFDCVRYGLYYMQRKWDKRDAIMDCTTIEQIQAIDWNSTEL